MKAHRTMVRRVVIPSPSSNRPYITETAPRPPRPGRSSQKPFVIPSGRPITPALEIPPVRVGAPRTEPVVVAGADGVLEHDAGILQLQHPAGGLVDDPLDRSDHAGLAAAVLELLGVELHAVAVARIEGLDDLVLALDPNEFTRLQVEELSGGPAQRPIEEREALAVVDPEPAGGNGRSGPDTH